MNLFYRDRAWDVKELEILEDEYAEGLIDQKTYNRRLESLERERREIEE